MNDTTKLKYIWFTFDGCGLSVARKLEQEGNTVIVAQIQDVKELHCPGKTEEPEDKKTRLKVFDGLIQKHDAKKVIKQMKNIPDKDAWFIVFDLNSLWYYAQLVHKLGFNNGFFPTEEDTLFEDDRDKGKELVKEFWPDLEVAPVGEFKTIEDGISYLEEHPDDFFVLKANTEGDFTVLPESDDPELARENLIGALKTNKSDYESKGFILELKISDPIEITPEMVFYNGEPIFSDIDIENKPVGSGSIGNMTGCAGNLIIHTPLDAEVNRIAFPDKVYEMAQAHPGLFIWDASLLIDSRTRKIYFGEFCPNRWGYDAFFTEIAMCDSASSYFEGLVSGTNPIKHTFGVAVRIMNLKKFDEANIALKGDETDLFFYDARMKDDHLVSNGMDWALVVAAGAADDVSEAVDTCYENISRVSFTGGYYRPKFDFNSTDYQNSIPNRYNFSNGWLFDTPEWSNNDARGDMLRGFAKALDRTISSGKKSSDKMRDKHQKEIAALNSKHEQELAALRDEIDAILNS